MRTTAGQHQICFHRIGQCDVARMARQPQMMGRSLVWLLLLALTTSTVHGFAATQSSLTSSTRLQAGTTRPIGRPKQFLQGTKEGGGGGGGGRRRRHGLVVLHQQGINGDTTASIEEVTQNVQPMVKNKGKKVAASDENGLKNMLKFALPALGIYLSNPLLSNIDNGACVRVCDCAHVGVTGERTNWLNNTCACHPQLRLIRFKSDSLFSPTATCTLTTYNYDYSLCRSNGRGRWIGSSFSRHDLYRSNVVLV